MMSGIVKDITTLQSKPDHLMFEFHIVDSDKTYGRTFSDPSLANYSVWSKLNVGDHISGMYWYNANSGLINGDSPVIKVTLTPNYDIDDLSSSM